MTKKRQNTEENSNVNKQTRCSALLSQRASCDYHLNKQQRCLFMLLNSVWDIPIICVFSDCFKATVSGQAINVGSSTNPSSFTMLDYHKIRKIILNVTVTLMKTTKIVPKTPRSQELPYHSN